MQTSGPLGGYDPGNIVAGNRHRAVAQAINGARHPQLRRAALPPDTVSALTDTYQASACVGVPLTQAQARDLLFRPPARRRAASDAEGAVGGPSTRGHILASMGAFGELIIYAAVTLRA